MRLQHDRAFEAKQEFFCLNTRSITAQRTVMADHAMARHNNREWIATVRRTDSTKTARHTDPASQLLVRYCRSIRNLRQLPPHALLNCGADLIVRDSEFRKLAVEVTSELLDDLFVLALVLDNVIVVKMSGEPTKEILLGFSRNTDLTYAPVRRSDVDVSDLGFE